MSVLNNTAQTIKVKLAVTLFYIRIKVIVSKTDICPYLPDLSIALYSLKLYKVCQHLSVTMNYGYVCGDPGVITALPAEGWTGS